MQEVHTIVPLALLMAMQSADQVPDSAGEPFAELAQVRFGGSDTVAAQIRRYLEMENRGRMTPVEEVIALVRLVARRPDADLVFTDAGRTAGRLAAERAGIPGKLHRVSAGPLKSRGGRRLARRLAREMFGVEMPDDGPVVWADSAELGAGDLAGTSCRLVGAATAELMHRFTRFDGALLHVTCRGRGDAECQWTTDVVSEAT